MYYGTISCLNQGRCFIYNVAPFLSKQSSRTFALTPALLYANAHHFILELPDQYQTIVGERGASISGGQKQRLCIARALLTKPRILALDEASSALDAPTEQDILKRLRFLLESKENNLSAVLFITHKRSVLQACDRVAVLSHGRIAETGAYDEGDQLRKLLFGEC